MKKITKSCINVDSGDELVFRNGLAETSCSAGMIPKVAIFLCTYQGQKFLEDQLHSFEMQTHQNWEVWASDDGSKDKTLSILEAFQNRWGRSKLSIHSGPSQGFVANFLSLTCRADVDADFFSYSDQDDIWEANKLERAVTWLKSIPETVPALYCARTKLVDVNNTEIGLSPLFAKPPSFQNALMQSIAGGNTMVFNKAARDLLVEAGDDISVISHDWWTYIVITGCGGCVFYDSVPTLRYRQHSNNLIGMNSSFGAKLKRIKMLFAGRFCKFNDENISAILKLQKYFPDQNLTVLNCLIWARKKLLLGRLFYFWKSGVHRQTALGNLALIVALIFNKV